MFYSSAFETGSSLHRIFARDGVDVHGIRVVCGMGWSMSWSGSPCLHIVDETKVVVYPNCCGLPGREDCGNGGPEDDVFVDASF